MQKTTVYGLPLNPRPLLEQLRGQSFCVSYATRKKLGKQLDQAIDLVGDDGILLVDNGAFSHWKTGGEMTEEYIEGFEAWAAEILDRCPQAIAVIPDIIGGTLEANAELVCTTGLDSDRCMPVWHTNEPISYLLHLCEGFSYVAIGSTREYNPGSKAWHARMQEAFAAIDRWEEEMEGAYIRPRIHMMRAQNYAHCYPFDSSDSTNVAVNHNRQLRKSGENVSQLAARVDRKIQESCDQVEAEHQAKRPLLDHLEQKAWEERMRSVPNVCATSEDQGEDHDISAIVDLLQDRSFCAGDVADVDVPDLQSGGDLAGAESGEGGTGRACRSSRQGSEAQGLPASAEGDRRAVGEIAAHQKAA